MATRPYNGQNGRYLFKVIMAGSGNSGKKTLIQRYTTGLFSNATKMTIGVDFSVASAKLPNGNNVTLQVWDFGGEDRFRSMIPSFCIGAAGSILVFNPVNPETFYDLTEWVTILRNNTKNIPLILVSTNQDLIDTGHPSAVPQNEIEAFCKKYQIKLYLPVSAKTGQNVIETFQKMSALMIEWDHHKESGYNPIPLPYEMEARAYAQNIAWISDPAIDLYEILSTYSKNQQEDAVNSIYLGLQKINIFYEMGALVMMNITPWEGIFDTNKNDSEEFLHKLDHFHGLVCIIDPTQPKTYQRIKRWMETHKEKLQKKIILLVSIGEHKMIEPLPEYVPKTNIEEFARNPAIWKVMYISEKFSGEIREMFRNLGQICINANQIQKNGI